MFVPHVPTPPMPSPRAQRLAGEISGVIEEFAEADARLDGRDVAQALELVRARQRASGGGPDAPVLRGVLVAFGGLAALALVLALGARGPSVAVVLGAVLVVGVVVAVSAIQRR